MEFGQITDNPFAAKPRRERPPSREAFVSAIKFLLLIAIAVAGTLMITAQSRRWLVARLTADFGAAAPAEKQTRLIQLAHLGTAGIQPLVAALADQNPQVARSAYELLVESQQDWKQLPPPVRRRYQQALIDALRVAAVQVPADRTGWGTQLLQQAVLADGQLSGQADQDLYRQATAVIDRLALTERGGPGEPDRSNADVEVPTRVAARQPTIEGTRAKRPDSVNPETETNPEAMRDRSNTDPPATTDGKPGGGNSIYRSGGTVRLRPVVAGEPADLRDLRQHSQSMPLDASIQSVAHVVDSPLTSLDDPSVMKFLGSPHSALRQRAETELQRRGFDRTQISIAARLAVGDTAVRLQMIDAITRTDRIDPRPWLLMLLDDPSPQIQRRVVSVLATMQDAYIDQRLLSLAADQPDSELGREIRSWISRR